MPNNKYRILVIEDEDNIRQLITALLESNSYQVITADTCESGKMLFFSHLPDLTVLDLGLPDADGMEFIKTVRKESPSPIIVLSARTNEAEKVEALDNGANDYITKPFGSAEFLARIRSTLRTTRRSGDEGLLPGGKFNLGKLEIDYDKRRVYIAEKEIPLTQNEYNIVTVLAEHCGKVLTYSFIIKQIWGYTDEGSVKKLQVNMANIRKKFGAIPGEKNYIINELGVGYRMNAEVDE